MRPVVLLAQIDVRTEPENDALEQFLTDNATAIGLIVMVLALMVGAAMAYGYHVRHRRTAAMLPTARAAGLEFSYEDRYNCTRVAFGLFRAGDGRKVENVMSRTGSNGMPVRVFDYAYYHEYKDPETGRVSKTWRYLNCALARHNGYWPEIRITRERTLDRALQKAGLPDIEMESEEFNRTFVVQCADRKFATDLIDPQMMEFLLTTAGLLDFQTKGRWLLVTSARLDHPREMVALLNIADEFLRRIPLVIWDLYPEAPDSEDGRAIGEGLAPHEVLEPEGTIANLLREELAERRPEIEYDLDGNPVQPRDERPWD